jgi:hypothetical protein
MHVRRSTNDKYYPLVLYQPMCQMKRPPRVGEDLSWRTPLIILRCHPPLLDGATLVTSIAPHTRPLFKCPVTLK